jgi:predicted NBD/HSP70 family sugar kinase
MSRLELAERTGLTPQAVSKITARLREDGLATEAGRQASTGGKPRTVLRLVPEAGHAVGLHLDRDELRVVLVDLTGAVVGERGAPLDLGAGADAVWTWSWRSSGRWWGAGGRRDRGGESGAGSWGGAAGSTVLGVGVAMPGPLDHTHGVLHRVTGFPEWDGFPLRDALARRLGVPVVLDKDTNAAALGLAVGGEGGAFAYLHLGTGLGAGLVLGGAVHRGPGPGRVSSGTRSSSWTGRPATAATGGASRRCASRRWRGGTWTRRRGSSGKGPRTLWGCSTSTLCCWAGARSPRTRARFVRGVGAVLDARARREGAGPPVPVRVASGGGRGVAEGAAQLLLGPLFGRAEG